MSSNTNASKKYYVYSGHYEMYISDVPMYAAPSNYPYRTFSTFEKAFEYASKKEVDILYSERLKDEVCDFYGDSDYYNDNTEFFFNPEKPINETYDGSSRINSNKNIFFAAVIGYDKNGNKVSCNEGSRDTVVRYQAIPLKVNTSANMATELGVYYIATYCETYRHAVELADFWNTSYKDNGTYFE